MIADGATYLAYAGGWQAVRRMPEAAAYGLFGRLADLQWRRRTKSVRRLEANLARAMPGSSAEDLREASRAGMRSYLRYWCDAFRLPGWDSAKVDTFEMTNEPMLHETLAQGRGAVVALPHMGNWDHAGAYTSLRISPVHTVAEKLEPARLYDAFVSYRESLGMTIYGLGDPGVYGQLAATLQAGGLVALLADRDLSAKGIDVDFLGELARFPAGPAALAVDTGAALIGVELFWDGHNCATLLPAISPPATGTRTERIQQTTQALADSLGEAIRRHPVDWHMLQRLWLADLDQSRLAARDAARDSRGTGDTRSSAEAGDAPPGAR